MKKKSLLIVICTVLVLSISIIVAIAATNPELEFQSFTSNSARFKTNAATGMQQTFDVPYHSSRFTLGYYVAVYKKRKSATGEGGEYLGTQFIAPKFVMDHYNSATNNYEFNIAEDMVIALTNNYVGNVNDRKTITGKFVDGYESLVTENINKFDMNKCFVVAKAGTKIIVPEVVGFPNAFSDHCYDYEGLSFLGGNRPYTTEDTPLMDRMANIYDATNMEQIADVFNEWYLMSAKDPNPVNSIWDSFWPEFCDYIGYTQWPRDRALAESDTNRDNLTKDSLRLLGGEHCDNWSYNEHYIGEPYPFIYNEAGVIIANPAKPPTFGDCLLMTSLVLDSDSSMSINNEAMSIIINPVMYDIAATNGTMCQFSDTAARNTAPDNLAVFCENINDNPTCTDNNGNTGALEVIKDDEGRTVTPILFSKIPGSNIDSLKLPVLKNVVTALPVSILSERHDDAVSSGMWQYLLTQEIYGTIAEDEHYAFYNEIKNPNSWGLGKNETKVWPMMPGRTPWNYELGGMYYPEKTDPDFSRVYVEKGSSGYCPGQLLLNIGLLTHNGCSGTGGRGEGGKVKPPEADPKPQGKVDWTYDNTGISGYAEIKNGKDDFKERFEVMAGVPSKENLHLTVSAPSMYAKVDGEVYHIDKLKGQTTGESKILVNIPWFETDDNCECKVTLSGSASGNWTVKDSSSFSSCLSEIQSKIEEYNSSCEVCGGGVDYEFDEEENPTATCGGKTGLDASGPKKVTVPACCFDDASPQTIEYNSSASASCECDASQSASYTVTFTMNHKLNGFMGNETDWQNYVKLESTGGTDTAFNSQKHNAVEKNTNNYSFHTTEVGTKNSNGSGDDASAFNHIKVMSLMVEPKYHIFTADGGLWTAKMKNDPEISVLTNTKADDLDDENFNIPANFKTNIGNTTEVVSHRFERDLDRFSIDIANTFVPISNPQAFGKSAIGSGGAPKMEVTPAPSHFWRGILNPSEKIVTSPGFGLSVSPGGGIGDNFQSSSDMYASMWHGGLTNKRLSDTFKATGGKLSSDAQNALSENLKQLQRIIEYGLTKANGLEKKGLFFSTDKLSSDAQILTNKYRDVRVLDSGYLLTNEDGIFREEDTITDGNITVDAEGKYQDTPNKLETRLQNLSLTENETEFVLGLVTNELKSECGAEEWVRAEAFQNLVANGRDSKYYSLVGYNGYYRLFEGEKGESQKKLMKYSGLGIAASGEAAFYDEQGLLHCYRDGVMQTTVYPKESMHKFKGNHYQEASQKYMIKLDKTDKIVTMKETISQGEHEPIGKIVYTYTGLTKDYLDAKAGTSCTKNSKYINDDFGLPGGNDGNYINSIYVRNPASVQYCRVLCNPAYRDMRVTDENIFKGGESRNLVYNNREQTIDTDNIKYINSNEQRAYYNYMTRNWDTSIEERRDTVNFINIGSEFQMLYSDKYNIFYDQFDHKRELSKVDAERWGIKGEVDCIVDDDNEPIYCKSLFGLSDICDKMLGFGWGEEANSDGLNYSSAFPARDMWREGTHNYVVKRELIIPFDCTLLNKDKQFVTYRADQKVDLNTLYQWKPANDLGLYQSLETVDLKDCEIDGNIVFKFAGEQHPNMLDEGLADDAQSQDDRLIYGLCLLSNPESVNVRTGFFMQCLPNGDGSTLWDADVEQLKVINTKMYRTNKDGATAYSRIDMVGSIGNLTLNDVGDFRFSNLFKTPLAGTWLIQGSVRGVDTQDPNKTMQLQNNIMGDENEVIPKSEYIKNGNTVGTQEHKESFLQLPINAYVNNNEAYQNVQLKLGYRQYFDVETIGNYNGINTETDHLTNRLSVKPRYYLYNYDTEEVQELDMFYDDEGSWKCANTNKFNIGTEENLGLTLNQTVEEIEENRSNSTEKERELTKGLIDEGVTEDAAYFTSERDYIIGTTNLMTLDQKNRDYIGGTKLRGYETIYSSSSPGCAQLADGEWIEPNDTTGKIGELNFAEHNQKYYFTLAAPSSIMFIPTEDVTDSFEIDTHGEPLSDYIDKLNKKYTELHACVLETLQIQSYGPVWSLELKSDYSKDKPIRVTLGDEETYDVVNVPAIRNKIKGELVAIGDLVNTSSADYNVKGMY